MMARGAGISVGGIVVVLALAGCRDLTGPKEDAGEGRFGIGNSSSFVTTGGASGDLANPDDITFIVDLFTQRMSFNAKGGANATGVFNFTGKVFGINTHIHGDIVCYAIDVLTNTARVSGHITSSDPQMLDDQDAVWIVQDNGEGNGPPDKISLYSTIPHNAADPNANCAVSSGLAPTMYEIVTGNVQIHN